MKHTLPYKYEGLVRLVSLKDSILEIETALNQRNNPLQKADTSYGKIIDHFISVFCEHELADTDYIQVQKEAIAYKSLTDYIKKNTLCLPFIIKCLTYFIWTDQIIDGYFINRVKDNSLTILLTQLKDSLEASHPVMHQS